MYWLAFGFSQLLCAGLAGWWFESWNAVLLGALLGAWLWWLLYAWQGRAFFQWSKNPHSAPPRFIGIWSHLEYFARKQQLKYQKKLHTMERELHDLQSALQASPNGVLLVDENWRIVWLNKVASEHFGLDPGRDIGHGLTNLVRSPDFGSYCAVGNFSHPLEMQGRGQDAMTPDKPQLSIVISEYGDGNKLLLSRDITILQKNESMRRDFVANVSHEIRTPLTIFSGFVETLQTLPLTPAEQTHYLNLMQQQTGRMLLLVQDLLTLSRLEAGPMPSLNEYVNIHTLLVRCSEEANGLSSALAPDTNEAVHRITVQWVDANGQALTVPIAAAGAHGAKAVPEPHRLGRILAVEQELHSAVANIVSNAVRYTPAGGSIEVQWRWAADGSARFIVRDSGPGIAPEHIPRLTERFYRVDKSRSRETGGTGLGLAIVKHIIQRHGGKLRVESELGKGSVFSLEFPASRLQTPEVLEAETKR